MPVSEEVEPHTIENALDILRSWDWLYRELERADVDTDGQVIAGSKLGRNRQCSIGYHEECSDRSGINWNGDCGCPCHQASWEKMGTLLRWLDTCLAELAAPGDGVAQSARDAADAQWVTLIQSLVPDQGGPWLNGDDLLHEAREFADVQAVLDALKDAGS